MLKVMQFAGDVGAEEIMALDVGCGYDPVAGHDILLINTGNGVMRADPGDWIFVFSDGKVIPHKNLLRDNG